MNTNNTIPTG